MDVYAWSHVCGCMRAVSQEPTTLVSETQFLIGPELTC